MSFSVVGSGRDVVFLHGWGSDGSVFFPVAKRLQCRCFLVDFCGFGKSPMPPETGWTVSDYAEDLHRFFLENSLAKATLVCHSFGCRVAAVFAACYPSMVEGIIMFGPAGVRSFSVGRWFKVKSYKLNKFLKKKSSSQQGGSADYRACSPQMKNTFVKVVNEDIRKYAKKIKCKVLIICGRNDKETPIKSAKKLAKAIPHSTLVEVEGDHFGFLLNSIAFANTVTMFLGAK